MSVINKDCKDYLIQAYIIERLVFVFKDKLKSKIFYNWILVLIFYTAHHYFYAFLCNKGEELPKSHKSYNYDIEKGGVAVAINKFYTKLEIKDKEYESAGEDYSALFNWSCFVRYNQFGCIANKVKEINLALNYLDRVKLVTFNDIGYNPERSGNFVIIKKVTENYLKHLLKSLHN